MRKIAGRVGGVTYATAECISVAMMFALPWTSKLERGEKGVYRVEGGGISRRKSFGRTAWGMGERERRRVKTWKLRCLGIGVKWACFNAPAGGVMRRLGGAKQDAHLEGSLLSVPPFSLEEELFC